MLAGKIKSKSLLCLKIGGLIFFALAAFFVRPMRAGATADLIINEIMYNLAGVDDKHEWIELYNASSSEINLEGFKINDGDDSTNHSFNAPPKNNSRGSMTIPPQGYLLLADDASTDALDLPNYSGNIIDTVFTLPNISGALKIIDKEGKEISLASYSKQMGAYGNGKTLEWDGTQFIESLALGGTPGAQNSNLDRDLSANLLNQLTPSNTTTETIAPNYITTNQPSPALNKKGATSTASIPVTTSSPALVIDNASSDQKNEPTPDIKITAEAQSGIKKIGAKTLPWLLATAAFSALSALGLIYFKHRQKPAIDSKKTNDTI
jgi:hypothetical protein